MASFEEKFEQLYGVPPELKEGNSRRTKERESCSSASEKAKCNELTDRQAWILLLSPFGVIAALIVSWRLFAGRPQPENAHVNSASIQQEKQQSGSHSYGSSRSTRQPSAVDAEVRSLQAEARRLGYELPDNEVTRRDAELILKVELLEKAGKLDKRSR